MPYEPGPVDIGEVMKPVHPDANWPARAKPQFLIVTPEQLERPHQLVEMRNNDRQQIHIIIDRFLQGHELAPGQTKEIDLTVDDIDYFRRQRAPNRLSPDGLRVLPVHPVEVLGIREAPPANSDAAVQAALETERPAQRRRTADGHSN
jgi:hypothetical protein